ncbi:squalene synthase HpnC [Faunimonas pinastri]|uniref:Squalene synthase HpnC n=1 Tax=Faunimonas pinastri TaxID=1855383 RepID=A0A1H9AIB3_9HYPH|nr:squalene synthase HpnC [Faunimonas pinastri]SEP76345.1 squalene synthase HpnC [Faunimonas pinastri]
MITASEARSGKSDRDENFPVARLIGPKHREAVLAFYHFVRAADDVADHPTLSPAEKLALLDGLEGALTGAGPRDPEAEPLRNVLVQYGLPPRHALDLLAAFRLDVEKPRTADWGELMHYCSLSAMPVGRYVLDIHGESRDTWAASDPLCAALQVINHLQDCGEDYRDLDRVYLPEDVLAAHGASVTDLGAAKAGPALRAALRDLAGRTGDLLRQSAVFPGQVRDFRLSMNVAAIQKLAENLNEGLKSRDPLADVVHHDKMRFALIAGVGMAGALGRRLFRRSHSRARAA